MLEVVTELETCLDTNAGFLVRLCGVRLSQEQLAPNSSLLAACPTSGMLLVGHNPDASPRVLVFQSVQAVLETAIRNPTPANPPTQLLTLDPLQIPMPSPCVAVSWSPAGAYAAVGCAAGEVVIVSAQSLWRAAPVLVCQQAFSGFRSLAWPEHPTSILVLDTALNLHLLDFEQGSSSTPHLLSAAVTSVATRSSLVAYSSGANLTVARIEANRNLKPLLSYDLPWADDSCSPWIDSIAFCGVRSVLVHITAAAAAAPDTWALEEDFFVLLDLDSADNPTSVELDMLPPQRFHAGEKKQMQRPRDGTTFCARTPHSGPYMHAAVFPPAFPVVVFSSTLLDNLHLLHLSYRGDEEREEPGTWDEISNPLGALTMDLPNAQSPDGTKDYPNFVVGATAVTTFRGATPVFHPQSDSMPAAEDTPLALFLMSGGQLEVCSVGSFYDQEHACVVHDPQAPPAPPVPPVPSSGTAATQPAAQPEAGEAAQAPAAHVETGPPPLEEFLEDPAVLPDEESVATQLRPAEQRPGLRVAPGLVDGVDDAETDGDEWEDQNRGIENQLPTWQSTASAVAMEPLQVSTRSQELDLTHASSSVGSVESPLQPTGMHPVSVDEGVLSSLPLTSRPAQDARSATTERSNPVFSPGSGSHEATGPLGSHPWGVPPSSRTPPGGRPPELQSSAATPAELSLDSLVPSHHAASAPGASAPRQAEPPGSSSSAFPMDTLACALPEAGPGATWHARLPQRDTVDRAVQVDLPVPARGPDDTLDCAFETGWERWERQVEGGGDTGARIHAHDDSTHHRGRRPHLQAAEEGSAVATDSDGSSGEEGPEVVEAEIRVEVLSLEPVEVPAAAPRVSLPPPAPPPALRDDLKRFLQAAPKETDAVTAQLTAPATAVKLEADFLPLLNKVKQSAQKMGQRVQWIQQLSDEVAGIPSEAMQQQLEAATTELEEWHMHKAVAVTSKLSEEKDSCMARMRAVTRLQQELAHAQELQQTEEQSDSEAAWMGGRSKQVRTVLEQVYQRLCQQQEVLEERCAELYRTRDALVEERQAQVPGSAPESRARAAASAVREIRATIRHVQERVQTQVAELRWRVQQAEDAARPAPELDFGIGPASGTDMPSTSFLSEQHTPLFGTASRRRDVERDGAADGAGSAAPSAADGAAARGGLGWGGQGQTSSPTAPGSPMSVHAWRRSPGELTPGSSAHSQRLKDSVEASSVRIVVERSTPAPQRNVRVVPKPVAVAPAQSDRDSSFGLGGSARPAHWPTAAGRTPPAISAPRPPFTIPQPDPSSTPSSMRFEQPVKPPAAGKVVAASSPSIFGSAGQLGAQTDQATTRAGQAALTQPGPAASGAGPSGRSSPGQPSASVLASAATARKLQASGTEGAPGGVGRGHQAPASISQTSKEGPAFARAPAPALAVAPVPAHAPAPATASAAAPPPVTAAAPAPAPAPTTAKNTPSVSSGMPSQLPGAARGMAVDGKPAQPHLLDLNLADLKAPVKAPQANTSAPPAPGASATTKLPPRPVGQAPEPLVATNGPTAPPALTSNGPAAPTFVAAVPSQQPSERTTQPASQKAPVSVQEPDEHSSQRAIPAAPAQVPPAPASHPRTPSAPSQSGPEAPPAGGPALPPPSPISAAQAATQRPPALQPALASTLTMPSAADDASETPRPHTLQPSTPSVPPTSTSSKEPTATSPSPDTAGLDQMLVAGLGLGETPAASASDGDACATGAAASASAPDTGLSGVSGAGGAGLFGSHAAEGKNDTGTLQGSLFGVPAATSVGPASAAAATSAALAASTAAAGASTASSAAPTVGHAFFSLPMASSTTSFLAPVQSASGSAAAASPSGTALAFGSEPQLTGQQGAQAGDSAGSAAAPGGAEQAGVLPGFDSTAQAGGQGASTGLFAQSGAGLFASLTVSSAPSASSSAFPWFGQSSSSAGALGVFGPGPSPSQVSAPGMATGAATSGSSLFGQSAFGAGNAFGSFSSGSMGLPSAAGGERTAAASAPSLFEQPASSAGLSVFGQLAGGGTGLPFGDPASSSGGGVLGQAGSGTPGSIFGQLGGSGVVTNAPFGQRASGAAPTPFGQAPAVSQSSMFGQASAAGFSPMFGQTAAAPSFGQPANVGFGQMAQPGFGQPSMVGSGFGSSMMPGVASNASLFGQKPSEGGSAFGQVAGSAASPFLAFAQGVSSGGGFGAVAQASRSVPAFGTGTLFGNNAPMFPASTGAGGGAVNMFAPRR